MKASPCRPWTWEVVDIYGDCQPLPLSAAWWTTWPFSGSLISPLSSHPLISPPTALLHTYICVMWRCLGWLLAAIVILVHRYCGTGICWPLFWYRMLLLWVLRAGVAGIALPFRVSVQNSFVLTAMAMLYGCRTSTLVTVTTSSNLGPLSVFCMSIFSEKNIFLFWWTFSSFHMLFLLANVNWPLSLC